MIFKHLCNNVSLAQIVECLTGDKTEFQYSEDFFCAQTVRIKLVLPQAAQLNM